MAEPVSMLGGRVRLLPGDCIEVMRTLPENSVDAVVTDPPYLLEFMGKRWDRAEDSHALGISPFDAWFAGFVAGEGCFRIQRHKDGKYYACTFSIHLRADDAAVLRGLQERIGGRIVEGDARENKQGVKSAPDVRWLVETREGCWAIAKILDRAPLFAKKADDYALWRRALQVWTNTPKGSRWHGPRDVSEMGDLHRALQDVKRYDAVKASFDFDPFMPPAQAFHFAWAREALRILKPGGHLVAFGGTRTSHRMVCAIEDAGFQIRDQLGFAFGSGFPKSHDVSKGIDRMLGAEREVVATEKVRDIRNGNGRGLGDGVHASSRDGPVYMQRDLTTPTTAAARQWEGWGTALKPAWEPICLARKPLSESSIAANVLKWGTGAINVDGCRVGWLSEIERAQVNARTAPNSRHLPENSNGTTGWGSGRVRSTDDLTHASGRWPANLIHDGSEEVVECFPETASGSGNKTPEGKTHGIFDGRTSLRSDTGRDWTGDSGSAARFFYTAKADSDDRAGSKHPTVKPLDLIQYLCRLITPLRGVVLDPFAGTGTTGEAAWREGFSAILIEREAEYQADIIRRMEWAEMGPDQRTHAQVKHKGADDVNVLPLFMAEVPFA